MNPGLVVKLRPLGPWRSGPDSGLRNRVDAVYHSDSLYSAMTWGMHALGALEPWLDATARNPQGASVRVASCYPFQDDVGYVIPPRTLWPPMGGAPLSAPRVRWKSARFVPLSLIQPLLSSQILDEDRWTLDAASECLVPEGKAGPFRMAVRTNAAVDRLTGATDRHATACVEFYPGAGLWTVVSFADEAAQAEWMDRVKAVFRLLADTGFGGERSRGWGRCEQPEFLDGTLPDMILGAPPSETVTGYWMLSLFTPAAEDAVDWQRGNYSLVTRAGRIQGQGRSGDLKKHVHMVSEGSVVVAAAEPKGAAPNVAPDGYPHEIFRCGFALQVPLPEQVIQ